MATINENVIKNIANEITREAQGHDVTVDTNFVIYMLELLLLNPKYGKLFSKSINRKKLEFLVNEVVSMLVRGGISINIMKMQFLMFSQYDRLNALIDKHTQAISNQLNPLLNEILEDQSEIESEADLKKLYRKISMYIVLVTGLGDPTRLTTLKEGLGALESIFSLEDLRQFWELPRGERLTKLRELVELVGGVRLYNWDCEQGGEDIPDLSTILIDTGKTSIALLSHTMVSIVEKVQRITAVVESLAVIEEETGNVEINKKKGYTEADYDHMLEYLALHRQYEMFVRTLLHDTETLAHTSNKTSDRFSSSMKEIHQVVKHRNAAVCTIIFPLFVKVYQAYSELQNIMYLIDTINRIFHELSDLYDEIKPMTQEEIEAMTPENPVGMLPPDTRSSGASQMIMRNYVTMSENIGKDTYIHMMGFCSLCLIIGALVPSVVRSGVVHARGMQYGFCTPHMMHWFSLDPERYINEILEYVRSHPHLIHLLKIYSDVEAVRDVVTLAVKRVAKLKVEECGVQTGHPVESFFDEEYSWNMWTWKKRACKLSKLVNSKTHASQTAYSHLRTDIHCQTIEPRDVELQTKKDTGSNTLRHNYFIWGLRGQPGCGQHVMDLTETHNAKKMDVKRFETCSWPCYKEPSLPQDSEDQLFAYPSFDHGFIGCDDSQSDTRDEQSTRQGDIGSKSSIASSVMEADDEHNI